MLWIMKSEYLMNTWDTVIALIDIELNVRISQRLLLNRVSLSLYLWRWFLNSGASPWSRPIISIMCFCPPWAQVIPNAGRVWAPPLSRAGPWRVKLDIYHVKFHLVSCDSLFILSNLADSWFYHLAYLLAGPALCHLKIWSTHLLSLLRNLQLKVLNGPKLKEAPGMGRAPRDLPCRLTSVH